MTSPLINAARALVLAQSGADVFDDLEPEAQDAAVEHVLAVLRAIREPSPEMIAVGTVDADPELRSASDLHRAAVWQAMIDTILADR
jgi:hypothetical protein